MNLISRNAPVAYVAGAGSFLGLHLSKKLVEKNIQVVGLEEDLTDYSARQKNLRLNNRFITLKGSDNLQKELPRLDYAFFALPTDKVDKQYLAQLEKFLQLCEQLKPRTLLVSSISLYNQEDASTERLKEAEELYLASTSSKTINARIVRLTAVYGPGMELVSPDSLCRLLKAEVGQHQIEGFNPADYSTRAIFIDDAVDLIIKAVMHGATAHKIYDGALRHPIKLNEIKQILADPLGYENAKFLPTVLPEWLTPNLDKTEKELQWRPKTDLVRSLRVTVEDLQRSSVSGRTVPGESGLAKAEKELVVIPSVVKPLNLKSGLSRGKTNFRKLALSRTAMSLIVGGGLIFYSLLWPLLYTGTQLYLVKHNMDQSMVLAKEGKLGEAVTKSEESQKMISSVREQSNNFYLLFQLGVFNQITKSGTEWGQAVEEATSGINKTLSGTNSLVAAWQIITGNTQGDTQNLLKSAREELQQGEVQLNSAYGKLLARTRGNKLVTQAWDKELIDQIDTFRKFAEIELKFSEILLRIGELPEQQRLVLILQDNTTLTPGGGKPVAASEILIERGVVRGVNQR